MKARIAAMQAELLAAVADIGGMAGNLAEAADWADDGRAEEARLSLQAVCLGAEDAMQRLRTITAEEVEPHKKTGDRTVAEIEAA